MNEKWSGANNRKVTWFCLDRSTGVNKDIMKSVIFHLARVVRKQSHREGPRVQKMERFCLGRSTGVKRQTGLLHHWEELWEVGHTHYYVTVAGCSSRKLHSVRKAERKNDSVVLLPFHLSKSQKLFVFVAFLAVGVEYVCIMVCFHWRWPWLYIKSTPTNETKLHPSIHSKNEVPWILIIWVLQYYIANT